MANDVAGRYLRQVLAPVVMSDVIYFPPVCGIRPMYRLTIARAPIIVVIVSERNCHSGTEPFTSRQAANPA